MPKLTAEAAKRVETGAENAGDGSGFELLDEGVYVLRLRGVTVKEVGTSGKEPKLYGCPMWAWEYEIPEGHDHAGRRFWTNRILPLKDGKDIGYQHADFMLLKFAQPFEVLGATPDTDTDELIGKLCKGYVTQRTIQSGPKKGEQQNSLEELQRYTGPQPVAGGAAGDDDYNPDDELPF